MKSQLKICAILLAGGLTACSLAPPYHEPVTQAPPPAYKEVGDWQLAHPAESLPRGSWWSVFGDSRLDTLEQRVTDSNQDIKSAFARLEQARAQVRFQRASYFPTVTGSASVSRTRTSIHAPTYSVAKPPTQNNFLLESDVSYELDVFGRIRNSVAAARANAQSSAADLEAVILSMHAELAMDYFTLRSEDAEQALLDQTVAAYQAALQLNQNLYNGGAVPLTDLAQAQAQLETARTQAQDIRLQRTQTEHAIAVLVDEQASTFHVDPSPMPEQAVPPTLDPGLPSTLLERRPDVAAAERLVASANANIGVARAAYFPVFSLSAILGQESTSASNWLTAPAGLWAFGPSALLTLFDGGRRHAQSDTARAAYDEQVANYRKTVTVAYQEVEDALAALNDLDGESKTEAAAVAATHTQLEQADDRYAAGIANYLEVVIAENAYLTAELSATNIQVRRMNASVLLVKALGGGWDRQQEVAQIAH